MTGITVAHHSGRLVAVKQAEDADRVARLEREFHVLAGIEHPGVVGLVDFNPGPPATLRTTFIGPDSWAQQPPPNGDIHRGLASLFATIADLHDTGVTHGGLSLDHILVGPGDLPVLCGMADAGSAEPDRVKADRNAIADMVRSINDDDPLLDAVAADLNRPEVSLRSIIRRIDSAASTDREHRRAMAGWPSAKVTVIVGAMASMLVAAIVAIAREGDAPPSAGIDIEPFPVVSTAETTSTLSNSPPPAPTIDSAAPTGQPHGVEISHGGRRYTVGVSDDLVAVADWTCDGLATPAVLRPATGELAVFNEWPDIGGESSPHLLTEIDGAVGFVEPTQPCPPLRIETKMGSELVLVPEVS